MIYKKFKTYSLAEMKDKYIGRTGTKVRDEYEFELRREVMNYHFKNILKIFKKTK